MTEVEIRHAHLYCGMGGGKKGFNRGKARTGQLIAKPRCIGGIDVDPVAIARFDQMGPGRPGTVLDLFSRDQYTAFHGHTPPDSWREATTDDIRRAFGYEHPHVVFLSAPCKGFSGLLSETKSLSGKYQALNQLTLRGVWLTLEAHKDDPVEVYLFENVPRIATRGRHLLDQIDALFRAYDYVVADTTHDCGEIGNLAQSRKRFLKIARHVKKVPAFIYEPEKKPLRAVGEVLSKFPLPGDPVAGPMHRMPALQWKTWVRLAFVEAGSDWRSLERLRVQDGVLADYLLVPELYGGAYGVKSWSDHAGTVTSKNQPSSGSASVADPMVREFKGGHGVVGWNGIAGTVQGESWPSNGAFSVADPMIRQSGDYKQLGVRDWHKPTGTVSGQSQVGGGAHAVADPRIKDREPFNHIYRVVSWNGVAPAVTSANSGTAAGVADPRPPKHERWAGGKYRVTGIDETAGAVIAASTTGNGAFAVADPGRPKGLVFSKYPVTKWSQKTGTVIGGDDIGAYAVADPRHHGLRVRGKGDDYLSGGSYGVVPWSATAGAVTATGRCDNGFNNVADPRVPAPDERLVALIVAPDNTWHRPFTTLELAGLQSLIDPEEYWPTDPKVAREIALFEKSMWAALTKSDSGWREHIGNAVPPDAAEMMGSVIYGAILGSLVGESFKLSAVPVWVRPIAVAISVAVPA